MGIKYTQIEYMYYVSLEYKGAELEGVLKTIQPTDMSITDKKLLIHMYESKHMDAMRVYKRFGVDFDVYGEVTERDFKDAYLRYLRQPSYMDYVLVSTYKGKQFFTEHHSGTIDSSHLIKPLVKNEPLEDCILLINPAVHLSGGIGYVFTKFIKDWVRVVGKMEESYDHEFLLANTTYQSLLRKVYIYVAGVMINNKWTQKTTHSRSLFSTGLRSVGNDINGHFVRGVGGLQTYFTVVEDLMVEFFEVNRYGIQRALMDYRYRDTYPEMITYLREQDRYLMSRGLLPKDYYTTKVGVGYTGELTEDHQGILYGGYFKNERDTSPEGILTYIKKGRRGIKK